MDDYVFVKIDTQEMENGQAVLDDLREGGGGIPWMTILDDKGEELINSNGPEGNCGCPATEPEIDHFMDMIKQTCKDPSDEHLGAIRTSLEAYAKVLLGG